MGKRKEIVGKQFGRLLVLEPPVRIGTTTNYLVKCKCICGNIKNVRRSDLCYGKIKSCGCLNSEILTKRNTKHGMYGTREYTAWCDMRSRCKYEKRYGYQNYGGRGIKVYPEWDHSSGFVEFYKHIGPAPSNEHELDRINVNIGYEPGNVRWSTRKEQAKNKRNNHYLTHNNKTLCLADWSEITGIPAKILSERIAHNWSVEKTLTYPYKRRKFSFEKREYNSRKSMIRRCRHSPRYKTVTE